MKKKNSVQYQKMKIAEAKAKAAKVENQKITGKVMKLSGYDESKNLLKDSVDRVYKKENNLSMTVDEAKTIIRNSKVNSSIKQLVTNYTDELWHALISLADMNNNMFERVIREYIPNSDISQKKMFRLWIRMSFKHVKHPIDVITHVLSLYLSTPPKCISKNEMMELASDIGHSILENMNSLKKEGDMVYFTKEQFIGS
jgi:hypothetical protein